MLATLACVLGGGAAPAAAVTRPAPASIGAPAATAASTALAASSSALRCASTWKSAGFSSTHAVIATAVGLAESSCVSSATNSNGASGHCPNGSVDRGMWQINSCWHSEVSASCAFDPVCNAKAAYRISSSGTDWSPWTTYVIGAYKSHLSDAQSAVNAVYGGTSTGWPLVRQGQSGWTVTTVQYLLRAHGSTITVDGAFGPATYSAVRSFQSAHHLSPVDGIVGPDTWSALIVTVRTGSTGEAVKAAQNALRTHGSTIALDGAFGPATYSAVKSFQSAHHLSPIDGIVGPVTWQALVS